MQKILRSAQDDSIVDAQNDSIVDAQSDKSLIDVSAPMAATGRCHTDN